jgi:dTDP-4-amino-4,6-dideoxygalactose transaminase
MHPLKSLNVMGDGGMVVTDDDNIAEWMKKYRNHGMIDRDHIEFWGVNMRLQPLQAIVAMSRMKDLEDTIKIRNHNAMIYDNAFYELRNDVTLPQRYEGHTETFALYMGLFRQRDQLAAYLNKNGIETKIHYPVPLHQQKAAEQKCRISGDMTNADYQAQHLLTLPVHQYLREEQLSYTVDCISNFYRNA